jgi:hypothetical protein
MNLLQMRRQILELRRARDAAMVMKAACLARDAAGGSPVPLRPVAPAEAEASAMAAAAVAADVEPSEAAASPPATPTAPGEGSAPSLAAAVEGSLLELVHTLQAERLQVSEWGRERATRRRTCMGVPRAHGLDLSGRASCRSAWTVTHRTAARRARRRGRRKRWWRE